MLFKVASGQESHGFPPGFYLLLMPLTLWPASAMAGVSVFRAWKSRSAPAVRFCLAWIIPAWIVFELVPTKLPHYVLPFYPALCLLVAHTIISSEEGDARRTGLQVRENRVCFVPTGNFAAWPRGPRPPLVSGPSLRTGRPDSGYCGHCGGGAFHLEVFQAPLRPRRCCHNRCNCARPGALTSMDTAQR